jgi:hypothetical protein
MFLLLLIVAGAGMFFSRVARNARRGAATGNAPVSLTASSDPLMYPGAQVITISQTGNNGSAKKLVLTTNDSPDKVTDWYIEKIHPEKTVRLPFGLSVLKAKNTKVVITPGGSTTTIIVKPGADGDDDDDG